MFASRTLMYSFVTLQFFLGFPYLMLVSYLSCYFESDFVKGIYRYILIDMCSFL